MIISVLDANGPSRLSVRTIGDRNIESQQYTPCQRRVLGRRPQQPVAQGATQGDWNAFAQANSASLAG